MTLDSAICPHLRTQRTLPKATPEAYQPAYPTYAARFDEKIEEVAAVLIGAIAKGANSSLDHDVLDIVDKLLSKGDSQPRYRVLCSSQDVNGRETRAWKAYWLHRKDYEQWSTSSGFSEWWKDPQRESEQEPGWMLEALFPTMDRFETVFSNGASREGAATMCQSFSGEVEEHGYWGSARDRFPIAQTEAVPGEKVSFPLKDANKSSGSNRVIVPGRENLCVIHSGQDWSEMEGEERKLYLDTLHSTLQKGMLFLSNDKYDDDEARERFGCFECRFMNHLDPSNLEPSLNKSFGLCYFDDMASLERWSKQHKTHLNIFNGFFKYATDMQGKGKLSLWHEISIMDKAQQYFEYIGCPAGVGMLAALQKPVREV